MRDEKKEKEKEQILNWISPNEFIAKHHVLQESHTEGTGNWLLETLDSWFQGRNERVILCIGPGIDFGQPSLMLSGCWEVTLGV